MKGINIPAGERQQSVVQKFAEERVALAKSTAPKLARFAGRRSPARSLAVREKGVNAKIKSVPALLNRTGAVEERQKIVRPTVVTLTTIVPALITVLL